MKNRLTGWLIILLLSTGFTWGGEIRGQVNLLRLSENGPWINTGDHANAVVFVLGFDEPAESSHVYLDQKNKSFVPSVVVVAQNQSVGFRNFDPISHNIFSLSRTKPFDLGLYKAPVEKSILFDVPGLVKVFCNIHHQMSANILVLKNNKYQVTSTDGRYHIQNIPAGEHKIRVWTEGGSLVSRDIHVTKDSSDTIDFEIQVQQSLAEHLNKFGKPYKDY
ncbi:MAG: hypothetical protein HQM11_06570 [SAR324 cluster bacterium]|nr:hypothetical protein [SAR324 cluster bacterium]